ncbi:MAG: maleylpyruvate isomerase family mycothiol-dependent enzyme [Actinobacteria bacterium]|nr:maleylpyruvate isomerase family mycothiol-dependent enzyme [Actinomycetota bacterium]
MIRERDVDTGALYEDVRQQFLDLARGCSPEELDRTVPATPEWTVHDALAHVVGITTDLNRQVFFHPDGPDAWTAEQVDVRRGRSVEELTAEWDAEAPQFEEGCRLLGYEIGSHYVGDLLLHLDDCRFGMGRPVSRDGLAVLVSLDFYLHSFHEGLVEAGVGSVEVADGSKTVVAGAGDVVASVRAEPYDLLRSFGGRRSARQIRTLLWDGDADAVLPHVSRYGVPEADLPER